MNEPNDENIDSDAKAVSQDGKEAEEGFSSGHTVLADKNKTRLHQRSQFNRENGENGEKAGERQAAGDQTDPDATRYRALEIGTGKDSTRFLPAPLSSALSGADRIPGSREYYFPHVTAKNRVLKDRFLLEKVLGVGGMGVVYKARDRLKVEAKDRYPYVAIKMLNSEFNSHPEAFIALQRESSKTQSLSHQNIVQVFDFDRDGDVFFMTMEYMEGKPLDRLIKQYRTTGLPWDDVWIIVQDICRALQYAHAKNIVHADFKPGNIFVTTDGTAKIFDFGIARAVTTIEKTDGLSVHKTIFDAGSLGGLTPAYASCEMLEGQEPDVRDDIYALGCIVYELFTGRHPFGKQPADLARKQRLKPDRITDLKKRQWKVLEKALAFERKDRIGSVGEFYQQLVIERKPRYMLAISMVLLVSVVGFSYLNNGTETVEPVSFSEHDIRSELEFSIRLGLYKEALEALVENPIFSSVWEGNVWKEYQGVDTLLPPVDSWLTEMRSRIFSLYLNKIQAEISSLKFRSARRLIENAIRYSDNSTDLAREEIKLSEAINENEKLSRLANNEKEKVDRLNARNERQKAIKKRSGEIQARRLIDEYSLALVNVNKQLECHAGINMRDFEMAIRKLQSLNKDKYSIIKGDIVNSLAACISKQGRRFPERAIESRKYALRIFENNAVITSIKIHLHDACNNYIAGFGARGERAVCRDQVKSTGDGPDLVVVPDTENIRSFAIGRYEVSVAEFNQYCLETNNCSLSERGNADVPVTGQSVKVIKGYLNWLSKETGKKYRLPTKNEWRYAAASTTRTHDPNRNCQFRSRGIQKGDRLVKITTGKKNSWGLVNYLGNVQEWGYGKNGQLVVMGGSYITPMDECQVSSWQYHSGQPDDVTGFRVLRELAVK
ncbi:MAG: protein kinase [Gammaproteobacteria bacterium]|nr:protein kinase [Gammaproteobacteria bacterium]